MSAKAGNAKELRALITGGAQGIGLACARQLAEVGFDLAIADSDIALLKQVTLELRRRYRVEVTSHACDLSRVDHQEALVDVVGPIDAAIFAAGRFHGGDLHSTGPDEWGQGWNGRVFPAINLSRLIIPSLEERSGGVIVLVLGNPLAEQMPQAAGGGDRSNGPNESERGPTEAAPPSSRVIGSVGNAALAEFTRVAGSRSISNGVRLVAVNPGPTVTTEVVDFLADQAERRLGDRRRWLELVGTEPIPNRPEDVADVVSFLVSPAASSLSGTVIDLAGAKGH